MSQNIRISNNNIGFIFHHGWGYDSSYWENIAPLFDDFSCIFYDAGYFGNLKKCEVISTDVSWVGIGHSIGFAKLLEKHLKHEVKLSAIVGIQSFVNFLGNDFNLNKNRSIALEKMISAFKKYPIQVLNEFRKNIKLSDDNLKQINCDLLLRDLEQLKLNFSIPNDLPALIITSESDPVVDNTLIKDNFSNLEVKLKNINCDSHTLGYNNSEDIYECVMNFVKDVV